MWEHVNIIILMLLVCAIMSVPLACDIHAISGAVVITTTQLHSTKPELRFCAGSNPARGVLETRDGEDL